MGPLPRLLQRAHPLLQGLAERSKALWRGRAPASAPTGAPTHASDLPPHLQEDPRPLRRHEDLRREDPRPPRYPEVPRSRRPQDRRSKSRLKGIAEDVKVILKHVKSLDRRVSNLESKNSNWGFEGAASVMVCNADKMKDHMLRLREYFKELANNAENELPDSVLYVLGPW